MTRFGKRTLVKFVGGQLIARQGGATTASLIKDFQEVKRLTLDMRSPFEAFVRVWFRSERQVFREHGIPRWKRLSPTYRRWKAMHYPGKPIMRRTDRLWESLTRRTSDTVIRVGPRSLQLGTRVPYSRFHQEERPHVVLLPDAFAELSRMTLEHMTSPLRRRR